MVPRKPRIAQSGAEVIVKECSHSLSKFKGRLDVFKAVTQNHEEGGISFKAGKLRQMRQLVVRTMAEL